ncbi:MAG: hypothetical protein U1E89_04465 [Burkholderiaceae bacterium]
MTTRIGASGLFITFLGAWLIAGCGSMSGNKTASAPAPATTAAAPAAAAPAAPKVGPGMNERGEVVDPKKVEAGYGQKVKGINDWEGEITGKPAPGSKFTQLQIGMSWGQVQGILGVPTDQGSYITGKAFIPFFFGSDRYRHELVYKGQGRLIFAGSGGFDMNAHLVWIIHSANETGVR